MERMRKGARVRDKAGRTGTVVNLYLMQLKRRVHWDNGDEPSSLPMSELEEIG